MERTTAYYGDNYANLPPEIRCHFENINTARTFHKNQMVYTQGETADCFYYLKKGQVRIFFSSPDGMEKTLTVIGPGAILGEAAFFDGMPRVSSAKALQSSALVAVDRPRLLNKFRQEPDLALQLLNLQARSIRMLSSQVTSIMFLQADCRIARLLLQAQSSAPGKEPTVNMTHEEIGNIVGVSRVTVSKILNAFTRRGLVKTAYRSILLKDPGALAKIAEFDAQA